MINPVRLLTKFFSVILTPRGRLNRDVDYRDVRGGDFVDSLNNRTVTNLGSSTGDREAILGNEYVFKPDQIQLQNKKFRIYVSSAVNGTYGVSFFDGNGNLIGNFASVVVTLNNISQTLQDFAYTGVNSIQTVLTAASQTFNLNTVVTGTDDGYVEVEITTVPYWNYGCTNTTLVLITLTAEVVTSQESYDQSLIGDWNLIGSWDLQGELITWWTTQRNLPLELDINNITNNGSGRFRIQTTVAHGLVSNEKVVVAGVEAGLPTTIINGQWIVTVASATEFDLNGSVWGAIISSADATVTEDPQGIGELGRAVRNENNQTWSYTRLIRAKALNWVTKHQQDTLCKKDALRKYYRYTDDYNPIGNLYDRTINYQNDCLLSFVDPRNTYSYDNIGQESRFIQVGFDSTLTFVGQDQSGGAILSGNSRFSYILETDTLVPTTPAPLTNPVPATISSETGAATLFSGEAAGVITTKINNFLLTGDLVGNYKWVRLLVINYQGDAIVGYKLPRVLITSNSQTLKWTGNEQEEDLDVGTVQEITFGYRTALSIDELDGRVIFSNLTGSNTYDLSGFAQSLTHSVLRKELPSIGSRFTGTLSVNEYDLSDNVYNYTGYELNETYRFGLQAEFWDGGESLVYHIQDIPINTDAAYPRRVAALPDLTITDSTASTIYVPYLQFQNIDWNYILPSGQRLKDAVRRLRILRVERDSTNREIWSGIAVLGCIGDPVLLAPVDVVGHSGQVNSAADGAQYFIEFPFAEGLDFTPAVPLNPDYNSAPVGFAKYKAALYLPDDIYGESPYIPAAGDIFLDYRQPSILSSFPTSTGHTPPDNLFFNNLIEVAGDGVPAPNRTITDGTIIGFGTTGTLAGQSFSKVYNVVYTDLLPTYSGIITFSFPTSPVVELNGVPTAVANDRAIRRIQIYRAKTDKFGDAALSKYVTTGAILDDQTATTIDVFGGDVCTQKTWLRHRIVSSFSQPVTPDFAVAGLGGAIGFYAQNKVNTEMTDKDNSPTEYKYPTITEGDYLNTLRTTNPEPSYNSGYTLRNQVQSYAAYNPDQSLIASDFPVRIIYGERANPEQSADTQRIFLPLNFYDLPYVDGEIVSHKKVNSELYTWQENRFSQLYFKSNALIATTTGSEVVTGDGSALTNRPRQITGYGCPNKWLVGVGRSQGGHDVAYWLNPVLKCFIRYGYDGTTNQGVIHGMDSFFANNTSLLIGKDTPADGIGGHVVWNERFKEFITTVRAYRTDIEQWEVGKYDEGDLVYYGTTGFEEFPQFYVSLINNNTSTPPNASWQTVDITNPLFYNIYTLVFSEYTNGFDSFVSFRPKIYAQYRNTILSPKPVSDTGKMYEHNRGSYLVWYDQQAENGYVSPVFNASPNSVKQMKALRITSDIVPFRVECTTTSQKTFMVVSDFESRENNHDTAIKSDSTITTVGQNGAVANPTGSNELDTGQLFGQYMIVKFFFESGVYQSLSSIIVRGELSDRVNNS